MYNVLDPLTFLNAKGCTVLRGMFLISKVCNDTRFTKASFGKFSNGLWESFNAFSFISCWKEPDSKNVMWLYSRFNDCRFTFCGEEKQPIVIFVMRLNATSTVVSECGKFCVHTWLMLLFWRLKMTTFGNILNSACQLFKGTKLIWTKQKEKYVLLRDNDFWHASAKVKQSHSWGHNTCCNSHSISSSARGQSLFPSHMLFKWIHRDVFSHLNIFSQKDGTLQRPLAFSSSPMGQSCLPSQTSDHSMQ